jgi:hypothetical protein
MACSAQRPPSPANGGGGVGAADGGGGRELISARPPLPALRFGISPAARERAALPLGPLGHETDIRVLSAA